MTQAPIIFNQVLGPVTHGPSSSGTGGPNRIGLLCRQFLGSTPRKANIVFTTYSHLKNIYIGMATDRALLSGLMGRQAPNPGFIEAREEAARAGMAFSFVFEDFEVDGPKLDLMRLELEDEAGDTCTLVCNSMGGGTVLIQQIDGSKVDIRGDRYELILFTESDKAACVLQKAAAMLSAQGTVSGKLVWFSLSSAPEASILEALQTIEGVLKLRMAAPVHAVCAGNGVQPPFTNGAEMTEYALDNGLDLFQAAVGYERAVSGWSEERIMARARELWKIVRGSIEKGIGEEQKIVGYIKPVAMKMKQYQEHSGALSLGALDKALPAAQAVMETSNALGVIVCLPTGGSAGIVPAVLYAAAQEKGYDEEDCVRALLAAGAIGGCMAFETTFSGSSGGCQAEVASSAAMAAGGLCYLLGGSVQQCCDAASMALQSLLGLVCDPVGGMVQAPCMARNIAATATVMACVNAVLAGFDVVVPFHEMVTSMVRVGDMIRGVGRACGTCSTPTGCQYDPNRGKGE